MNMLLAVALGGALGSVGRYLAMVAVGHWVGTGFPWATLAVNILGSFAMGVLAETGALLWQPSPELRALVAVGVLGGFTTFSTFSLDVILLVQRGEWVPAGIYAVVSVILSVGALVAGLYLVRALAA